jgi:hypothetical protein
VIVIVVLIVVFLILELSSSFEVQCPTVTFTGREGEGGRCCLMFLLMFYVVMSCFPILSTLCRWYKTFPGDSPFRVFSYFSPSLTPSVVSA